MTFDKFANWLVGTWTTKPKLPKETSPIDAATFKKLVQTPLEKCSYEIVLAETLSPNDVIMDRGSRFMILECGHGIGAGNEYGEYVWVKGHCLIPGYYPVKAVSHNLTDFWLFRKTPTIKVTQKE